MENLTGRQLGPYQVVAPLGEGGMASVYRAYQPSMEREVAIKILPRQYSQSPEYLARFKQEARLLARLQHPHVLPVFDFGESDGYTYITMPLVAGGTLKDLMTSKPMPIERAATIVSQVGDALDYAHASGLVHRDIKPSNVLIDERGNALLMDFGIARMVEATTRLTQVGGVVGTPIYMSPEQSAGKSIDTRSDIYSLGIVLFELLTGHVPYNAETPLAVMFKHVNDPLPMPRSLNAALSDALEKVLLKALAKQPGDRFQTMSEFVSALRHASLPDTASHLAAEANKTRVLPGATAPAAVDAHRRWAGAVARAGRHRGRFSRIDRGGHHAAGGYGHACCSARRTDCSCAARRVRWWSDRDAGAVAVAGRCDAAACCQRDTSACPGDPIAEPDACSAARGDA
jgi:serine/threonine protein kinase